MSAQETRKSNGSQSFQQFTDKDGKVVFEVGPDGGLTLAAEPVAVDKDGKPVPVVLPATIGGTLLVMVDGAARRIPFYNVAAPMPAIMTQPSNQVADPGKTATFSVVATGVPVPTYQWKKNGKNIAGATAATYTTPPLTLDDDKAEFHVVVINPVGSVASNHVVLTVNQPAPVVE
jgi:hypothetical protein